MEKLKQLPMGVIIAVGVAILALAGFVIFRSATAQSSTTLDGPFDQKRYMEEMKKRAGSGGYSSNGQGPGGRGPGAAGAGAGAGANSMQQRMMGNYSAGGGMQGGGR